MKRFISWMLTLVVLLGILISPAASLADTKMMVIGGWLRLRAQPSLSAIVLKSYNTGTIVTVLDTVGEWKHVRMESGLTGYMMSAYLTDQLTPGPIIPPSPGSGKKATVVSANGKGVRLRSGPSKAYGILGVYPVGTVATILAEGTYWDYIRIGSMTGYMMSEFLSTGAPIPVKPGGYMAIVVSGNGLGVRLRTSPSKSAGIYGVYSVGTSVIVLEHGAIWDKVQIGTRVGYMMNQFLSAQMVQNVVTSVQMSTLTPKVGSLLSAVVQPGKATVTYRWEDGNGALLGTDATYTVKKEDAEKRICVVVTGTGLFTGSAKSALSEKVVTTEMLTAAKLSDKNPYVGQKLSVKLTPDGATASYFWFRSDSAQVGTGSTYVVQESDVGYSLACRVIGTGKYTGLVDTDYSNKVTSVPAPGDTKLSGVLTIPAAKVGETIKADADLNTTSVSITWFVDGAAVKSGESFAVPDQVGSKIKAVATALDGSGYQGSVTSNTVTIAAASKFLSISPDLTEIPDAKDEELPLKEDDTLKPEAEPEKEPEPQGKPDSGEPVQPQGDEPAQPQGDEPAQPDDPSAPAAEPEGDPENDPEQPEHTEPEAPVEAAEDPPEPAQKDPDVPEPQEQQEDLPQQKETQPVQPDEPEQTETMPVQQESAPAAPEAAETVQDVQNEALKEAELLPETEP